MSLGHAALTLAARGLRVFPIIERAKEPAIANNLQRATTNQHVIAGWWHSRDFNVGVATGPGSGIWVLDLDGLEHEAWLRKLEAEHGPLPLTVEAITGKGRHLYFRWPTGVTIRNIQNRDDFPDVRGDGGYVLAPPSLHPSGRRYAWSVDSASEFADAPEWLTALVAKGGNGAGEPIGATPEAWRSFVDDRFDGSHRGWAIARLSGLMLRRYLDPFVVLGIAQMFNESRCVEPLAEDEVTRIVDRIARREAERREREEGRTA
jgi:hypothetical protein